MYEADGLPAGWGEAIEGIDEVWVPSAWNKEVWVKGGVPADKISVVGEGVDSAVQFDPAKITKHEARRRVIPAKIRTNYLFLSVFKFEKRKGWEELVTAFTAEFGCNEPVSLILRTGPDPPDKIKDFIYARCSYPTAVCNSSVPLRFTHLLRSKRRHVCGQYHASFGVLFLTGGRCKCVQTLKALETANTSSTVQVSPCSDITMGAGGPPTVQRIPMQRTVTILPRVSEKDYAAMFRSADVQCSGFRRIWQLPRAIEFHAFAPLEAVPCVRSNGMPLRCSLSYRLSP
jgi:hypothetical protein